MQRTKADSTRTFLHWSAPIMVGHFHHRRMASVLGCQSSTGLSPICTSVTDPVNLLPIAGLVALVKGFPKLAESIITLPLAIALVIGTYAHFLSPGTDNVLRMPAGDLKLPFQISAVLLVLLEALGVRPSWDGPSEVNQSRKRTRQVVFE
jgi:hypothetical protein